MCSLYAAVFTLQRETQTREAAEKNARWGHEHDEREHGVILYYKINEVGMQIKSTN